LVPRQSADAGGGSSVGANIGSGTTSNNGYTTSGNVTTVSNNALPNHILPDFPSLDDLASSIADSPDFIMSSVEVNSPSPASVGGSDAGGGTFPLTETPPPGYMSEDGDTQEPGDIMSIYNQLMSTFYSIS